VSTTAGEMERGVAQSHVWEVSGARHVQPARLKPTDSKCGVEDVAVSIPVCTTGIGGLRDSWVRELEQDAVRVV
jgi:hypothetical protein